MNDNILLGDDDMTALDKIKFIFKTMTELNDRSEAMPGIQPQEIIDSFSKVGIVPPPELIELYQWHNGIEDLESYTNMLSLDRAIEFYQGYKDFKKKYPEFGWQQGWFPITDTNGDFQYCIDLNSSSLIYLDMECDLIEKVCDHYEYYLDALVYGFQNNIFIYDDDSESLVAKDNAWAEIAARYNIKLDY